MPRDRDKLEYTAKVEAAKAEYWLRMNANKDIKDHLGKVKRGLKGVGADLRKHLYSFIGDEDAKQKAEMDKLTNQLEDQAVSLKHKIKNFDVVFNYYCKRVELAMKHPEAAVAASESLTSIKEALTSVLSSFTALVNKLNPKKDPEGVREAQGVANNAQRRMDNLPEAHRKRPRRR